MTRFLNCNGSYSFALQNNLKNLENSQEYVYSVKSFFYKTFKCKVINVEFFSRDFFFFKYLRIYFRNNRVKTHILQFKQITSVLLRIIHLRTLIQDLLNWLYYPVQILPFSQVNCLSVSSGKKLVALSIPIPHSYIYIKTLSSR